jgi:glycosyltransferase involved in cell wall biosynthesis
VNEITANPAPMRIALVGTRGVPARYGGFETCVEEVGKRLAARGHKVIVYCRAATDTDTAQTEYQGMQLVHLPAMKRRSLETLSHTGLSAGHLFVNRVDAAIVFNAANAPFLPVLRAARIPVATHVDGLEWQRAKWGGMGKRYYRLAESLAVRWSDALIADAAGIQDYYRREFNVATTHLAYGAPILESGVSHRLAEMGLEAGKYHLVVARFEPENHVHLIVEGYARSSATYPLIVVGSAPYSDEYTRQVKSLGDERVRFVGGVWDQELLDQLYANALVYWHGHSVGGTNPSLLRAMGAGAATNAFDVNFNREVLGESGEYFADAAAIPDLIKSAEDPTSDTALRGKKAQAEALRYDWNWVAEGYEELCRKLVERGSPLGRANHGRRTGAYPLGPSRPLTGARS